MHRVRLITVLFVALVLVLGGCSGSRVKDEVSVEKIKNVDQPEIEALQVEPVVLTVEPTKQAETLAAVAEEESGVSQVIPAALPLEEPVIPEARNLPAVTVEEKLVSPFTGKPVQSFATRRPVMVMVENSAAARPQAGLAGAAVVYEFLVEGGISRFMALYYDAFPERVGPVRSTRPYFIHTVLEYDALLLHAGGSVEAYAEIARTGIAHIDEIKTGRYFWRESTRKAPHNLYTGLKRVKQIQTQTLSVNVPRFSFTSELTMNGTGKAAQELSIRYWGDYTVRYHYDENTGSYLRYIGQKLHVMDDGKKLYADNIFVQYVDTKITDAEGRLTMKMSGKGKALLIQDGFAYPGNWVKGGDEPTRFLQADGTEFNLNPGSTWIQVVPLSAGVEYR